MGIESKNYESQNNETLKRKEQTKQLREEISSDQKTIQALSYMTTLARLPENRDLDELFDGEVQLGEEELLTVYSLLELANGANTIGVLKTPKTMKMDVDWDQDYTYQLTYNTIVKNGSNVQQISSLSGTGTLPFNDTKLKFNYDGKNQMESLDFERPTNMNEGGWVGIDQKIAFKREKGLVSEISIMRDFELDNKLSVTYNYLGKPELIEQTKVGLLSDKMVFEYDEKENLKSIIYIPALSLKHLKGFINSAKQGGKMGGPLKAIKVAGEYVAFSTLKKMKGVDVVEIQSQNGLITSTASDLGASEWIYRKGFSKNTYSESGELDQVYLEREALGPDDKKKLQIKY